MCGFVCAYDPKGGMEKQREAVSRAGRLLSHRGPDDEGLFIDAHVGIHFSRLSVLDTSPGGHQPMISDSGRFVLAFNGEIYNYRELRDLLKKEGAAFKTKSDTEVLLKAYEAFGKSCVDYLRGMFAFVIWDREQGALEAYRDRLGIKPLFIYQEGSRTILSSEIKAILDLAEDGPPHNERTIFKYLSRGWLDDQEETFYRGIKNVPPAHRIRISENGAQKERYWKLAVGAGGPFDEEALFSTFRETVSLHLQSDVPLAATLSGGMDSSSITVLAANAKASGRIRAFSVIPPQTIDESSWIDAVARDAAIEHQYLQINFDEIGSVVGRALWYHDEPFQSSSCLYQYLLRRKIAEQGIKVLLVGEGGDEVFGGYRRFFYPYLYSLREDARTAEFDRALAGGEAFMQMPRVAILNELERFRRILSSADDGQENKSAYALMSEDFVLSHQDAAAEPFYPKEPGEYRNHFFAHLTHHLFRRDLPYVLRMEDRNSMAHGIESRVPFLDHRLIEQVFSYDYGEFMKGGENKSLLRRAMKEVLPKEVLERRSKSPRPGNDAHLMYDCLRTEMMEILSSTSFQSFSYWKKDSLFLFQKDAAVRDTDRAAAWIRIYLCARWLTAQSSKTVLAGSLR